MADKAENLKAEKAEDHILEVKNLQKHFHLSGNRVQIGIASCSERVL